MARKRRSGITEAEALLQRVIRTLETDDAPLEDPEQVLPLLRSYHAAFVDLLEHGPLLCGGAVAREREQTVEFPIQPADVSILRAELLQVVRSGRRSDTVPSGIPQASSTWIRLDTPPSFAVREHNGALGLATSGDSRDLVVLQFLLLLQNVGFSKVHECEAPDCQRVFVKVYRREFCSEQCQKRINTRKQRQTAREQKERLARRRRERRRNGA